MFELHESPVRHELADVPVELPFDVLLALPGYVGADPAAPVFDLPSMMGRLLGRFDWQGASRVVRPRIWAPGWSTERLRRFVSSPFTEHRDLFGDEAVATLAARGFPGAPPQGRPSREAVWRSGESSVEHYDVVHVLATLGWAAGPALMLAEGQDEWLGAAALSDALRTAGTRLLILQVPRRDAPIARPLAEEVVGSGGPAVLVVATGRAWVEVYLREVYARLVHNRPLAELATPPPSDLPSGEVEVHLYLGEGGNDLLRLDRWLENVQHRAGELASRAHSLRQSAPLPRLDAVLQAPERRLHRSQREALGMRLREVWDRAERVSAEASSAEGEVMNKLDWARESGGAEPLSRLAEVVGRLEAEVTAVSHAIPELLTAARSAEREAPRVLNANFARREGNSVEHGTVLDPHEPLVAGRCYDLLVDVGPRWDKVPSLVTGHDVFPDEALPASETGHVIDILFVGDDFEPRQSRGKLWLPSGTGRSSPYGGSPPSQPAEGRPLSLPLRVRTVAEGATPPERVGGRLFLYYENNLLQSAAVETALVAEQEAVAVAPRTSFRNRIDVDYVLSGTLSGLDERYARRRVRLSAGADEREHRLRLNLTSNHDPLGTHRILVHGSGLAPAWTAYDPDAAREALRTARDAMLACYWKRDGTGQLQRDRQNRPLPALDADGGKNRQDFATDLFHLARAGHRLYHQMLHSLRPADGTRTIDWERSLRQSLAEAAVIQISRIESAPTQYTYPWGLLYEYPMDTGRSRDWTWCRVVKEEWSPEGRRTGPLRSACPHRNQSWHAENVLCPYGFWGLKHVLEQPLAARSLEHGTRDPEREVRIEGEVPVAIGWTRDASLDLQRIDDHVGRIRALRGVRLAHPPPNPADDRASLGAVLPSSALAYFLCHCEEDLTEGQPFLWVGPRSDDPAGKIYVTTVTDWARTSLGSWARQRPLVFINACHSGDLTPGEILSFVSAFGLAGASGILGTEVSVKLDVAVLFAERLLAEILGSGASGGTAVGQAVRDVRWQLADRGNLLGLCYTFYGLADLHLVRVGEPSSVVQPS